MQKNLNCQSYTVFVINRCHQKFDVCRWINIRKNGGPSISVVRHKIPPINGPQGLKFHLFKYFSWIRTSCHGSCTIIRQVIGQLKKPIRNVSSKCTFTLFASRISTMTSERGSVTSKDSFTNVWAIPRFRWEGSIPSEWMKNIDSMLLYCLKRSFGCHNVSLNMHK